MIPLEPPDTHFLSAAIGWAELGNLREARTELAAIRPEFARHPDVLEAWWLICAGETAWEEALKAAELLVGTAPDRATGWLHRAYALRRIPGGSLQRAWDALLPAFEKFPAEPIIPYNLACYACQLGEIDSARLWLGKAEAIAGKDAIRRMALADADLKPLWEELRSQ